MISIETESCPICGCEPVKRRIRQILTWTLLIGAGVYFAGRYLGLPFHHHAQSQSNDSTLVTEDQ